MGKGFGIAAIILVVLAIFVPLHYGMFVSAAGLALATAAALNGDKAFAIAAPGVAAVNLFLLSPVVMGVMKMEPAMWVGPIIFLTAPILAVAFKTDWSGSASGGSADAPASTSSAMSGSAPSAPPTGLEFDRAKWSALLKFDDDIAAAEQAIRPYGRKWLDELARSYLALNDKTYLKAILDKTTAAAKQEQDALACAPKVVEEGVHKGRKWRRYDSGAIEGELLGGRFQQFRTLKEFQDYIA